MPNVTQTSGQMVAKTQRFKVRGSRIDFNAKIMPQDLKPDALQMSSGNKYHEGNNPHLGEFIRHVQGAISSSVSARSNMKNKTQMLFDKMRESRATYLGNLMEGEKQGVCKGIGRRLENKYKRSFEFMVKDPKMVAKEMRER